MDGKYFDNYVKIIFFILFIVLLSIIIEYKILSNKNIFL